MQCPECSSDDFTEISIEVKVDNSVKFYSCRYCEKKWWERNGDSLALDDVLTLATVSKKR
ncbi:MAG: hypothetical protein M3280_11105 [Actinomycetota bacterium]|nr:hypothetical protein [Actinomycetota bacterium]